ncbi:MAG: hypothetical protein ACO3FX_09015, partial [Gemmobacter sp.]
MSRPEILFPLFAEIETLPGVGPKAARALGSGLEIARPRDLIFTLPQAGIERRRGGEVEATVPDAPDAALAYHFIPVDSADNRLDFAIFNGKYNQAGNATTASGRHFR